MTTIDLKVLQVEQRYPYLGRQLVHDSRSRAFPAAPTIDKSIWHDKSIRVYDPTPNPNQCHGECTGTSKCTEFNALGNRVARAVLNMNNAHEIYRFATIFDPFQGEWPPDDTGSSGLGACKAAKQLGLGGEYRHVFGGADEVVQLLMLGRAVNVGTWWYENMFLPDTTTKLIEPTGAQVGGHQYIALGYRKSNDTIKIRCWWGSYRDVWIRRTHLDYLLMDGGDAHIQDRLKP